MKELGATELRGVEWKEQSRNNVLEPNPCTRDVEAPLVRRAPATRTGISIAAIHENFTGTGVEGRRDRFESHCAQQFPISLQSCRSDE